jgi:hypothetical protein
LKEGKKLKEETRKRNVKGESGREFIRNGEEISRSNKEKKLRRKERRFSGVLHQNNVYEGCG